MKINHGYQDSRTASTQESTRTQETAAPAQAKAARAAAGAGGTGSTSGADEVNLSPLAAALQEALSDSPERTNYLERLASEFADGTYNADPKDTARGIISDSLSGTDPSKR